jgi:hypothetical protein
MDILQVIVLELPCPNCGEKYQVSVAQIIASQQMLDEPFACRSETECPPMYLSRLLKREDLVRLREVWASLRQQANDAGGELLIRSGLGEATLPVS